MFVFFCRPADALLSSEPGGRPVDSGYSHSGTGLYVLSSFLFYARYFVSLCYAFSARHFPPLAGLWVVPTFRFVLVFAFFLAPPATMVACGRVLSLVSLVVAPVFSFNSPFFVSPPSPR